MLAVTSFHPEGYEKYGRRNLETFVKHWPINMVCYYEELPDFQHERIEYRPLMEIDGVSEFLEKAKRVPNSDGKTPEGYNYNWDAQKFCRKVFAQDAAFDLDDEVFWLDADVVSFRDVPREFLDGLIKGVPFCYLGRKDFYTETGFLGFNRKGKGFSEFRARYLPAFTTGKIFEQSQGWHDCIAFDEARKGIQGNNLSPKGRAADHVLLTSPIGHYIDHLKGPKRKKLGFSPGHPEQWYA